MVNLVNMDKLDNQVASFVGRLRRSYRLRKGCFVPVIGVTGDQAVIIRVSGYQGVSF